MNRWSIRILLIGTALLLFPTPSPAPLIYRPGEGFTYEAPGAKGNWTKEKAKDQLDVAQQAFDAKDYSLALKAAVRTVRVWPLSDYAPQAQYLMGRCYEAKHMDERAFDAYQRVLTTYPKSANYQEVQLRQFEIAKRFLAGQWFKAFGYIPLYKSMSKTADLLEKVVKNGPYSDVGPQAQLAIGAAREKSSDYPAAVKAYAKAADRYREQRTIAADALYRQATSYYKEAKTADYDQNIASKAVDTFTDFMKLYEDDPRVPEAKKTIAALVTEQARGNYRIAEYYEQNKSLDGALIYYNAVLSGDPGGPLADPARQRIDTLKKRIASK